MRIRGIAVVAVLLAACKPAGETPEQANARMQAESDSARTASTASARRYEAAMVANNIDSVVALYASNALIMPPNMPMARGTDSIKQAFTGMMSAGPVTAFTVNPISVSASGDLAVEHGTWKWSGRMNNAVVSDSGTYLIHWHRNGGNWKIMEHIWNSTNPPAPMPVARR